MRDFFERLRWKMIQFMQGRNGMDDLAKAVFGVSIACYIVYIFTRFQPLYLLALVGLAYYIFRIYSKNIWKRREENQKFLSWINVTKNRQAMKKNYKIFKCKGCGQKIRVPRGKGKIEVTCPKCGAKSIHKT